jgi:predicted nucleic acid-binding protein
LFFEKASSEKHLIVISRLSYNEIENKLKINRQETREALSSFKLNFREVELLKSDFAEAKKISNVFGIHFQDAVHVAVALRTKCDFIVTFNIKDFEKAREKIKIAEPKDFSQSLFL